MFRLWLESMKCAVVVLCNLVLVWTESFTDTAATSQPFTDPLHRLHHSTTFISSTQTTNVIWLDCITHKAPVMPAAKCVGTRVWPIALCQINSVTPCCTGMEHPGYRGLEGQVDWTGLDLQLVSTSNSSGPSQRTTGFDVSVESEGVRSQKSSQQLHFIFETDTSSSVTTINTTKYYIVLFFISCLVMFGASCVRG